MTENPRTVQLTDSVEEALTALELMDVRHLPVVDEHNEPVGMLSDRDLRSVPLGTDDEAVATRAREIATLRAIGFRGLPVVVSVLLETMLLALAGGVLGAAIAWILFDNYTVSTLGSNFSQVVFAFKVSPALLWNGLKWALAIGFVGGLFPALRAARLPVTTALREL